MKHKVSTLVAIALLAAAAVIGVVAVKHRSGHDAPAGSSQPTPGAENPTAHGTSTPSGAETLDPSDVIVIPKGIVNPLKARRYCQTAKLLAIYTKQGCGLNAKLGIVDGRKFDDRLRVIAATFERLADQASDQSRAGNAAPHWARLAEATAKAEEQLRVVGLRAQSQTMIAELGRWNQLSAIELPRATATLKAACGFSSAVFGI